MAAADSANLLDAFRGCYALNNKNKVSLININYSTLCESLNLKLIRRLEFRQSLCFSFLADLHWPECYSNKRLRGSTTTRKQKVCGKLAALISTALILARSAHNKEAFRSSLAAQDVNISRQRLCCSCLRLEETWRSGVMRSAGGETRVCLPPGSLQPLQSQSLLATGLRGGTWRHHWGAKSQGQRPRVEHGAVPFDRSGQLATASQRSWLFQAHMYVTCVMWAGSTHSGRHEVSQAPD